MLGSRKQNGAPRELTEERQVSARQQDTIRVAYAQWICQPRKGSQIAVGSTLSNFFPDTLCVSPDWADVIVLTAWMPGGHQALKAQRIARISPIT